MVSWYEQLILINSHVFGMPTPNKFYLFTIHYEREPCLFPTKHLNDNFAALKYVYLSLFISLCKMHDYIWLKPLILFCTVWLLKIQAGFSVCPRQHLICVCLFSSL